MSGSVAANATVEVMSQGVTGGPVALDAGVALSNAGVLSGTAPASALTNVVGLPADGEWTLLLTGAGISVKDVVLGLCYEATIA